MTQTTPQSIDLLIEARWVVPVEPHAVVLENHAVAIDGERIVALLPIDEARAAYAPRERVELGEHALIPGLVNSHTHNPMTLLRGGTTCANENYFFPDVIGATYRKLGFRAVVGLPVIEFPTAWAKSQDEYFERAGEVHDSFRGDNLVSTAFAPHAPYTVSDESFERIRMLSDQLDIPVHLHTHETAHEVEDEKAKSGLRPFQRLQKLGLVNDRLIAVHMTQLTDGEIAACVEAGVSVVHCPESNLKLASGFCQAEKLRKAGVNLALGTDDCASNNDLDMFGEMRTAALLAKAVAGDAAAFDAPFALRAATLNGAKAMGLDAKIGSIEPGKQADLAAVRLDELETQPLFNVPSQLVYATGRHQVTDVWIAGRRKLAGRVLVDMDVDGMLARTRAWRERIAAH